MTVLQHGLCAGHAKYVALYQIAEALAPLGIDYAPDSGGPGPDVDPLAATACVATVAADGGLEFFSSLCLKATDVVGATADGFQKFLLESS